MNKLLNIDYTDKSIFKDDDFIPVPSMDLTPSELEKLIVDDIHAIYRMKNAV